MSALEGEAAIVTGGGRGIGRAIVRRLLADGSNVLACGRGARPDDLESPVKWIQADVSRSSDAKRVVDAAMTVFGRVSILVNNAGIQVEKTVPQTTDDDWDTVIGVNCKGVFNMCREVIPLMETNGGSIVNVGSISGNVADPSMAIYNASKSFVHGLTRSIAVDHGPKVRCNAVSPGWIMTEMATEGFALAKDPERAITDAVARHPSGRLGKPEDVANAIAWLLDRQAGFVTGQCFIIDGGLTSASPLRPGLF
ncbi:short-chain dehydrogenase [Mesorhizobium loti]|uniref:Short-chain dehydrogenase n=1 Tax=Rhizobium loti TaxID=381 RepID=A0A101KPJ6_RHILI|nr:short-chain dehydrogenase [Mesorhizobium loti]